MLKTVQELKEQATKIGLTFYPVHDCSMCGYRCGYIIKGEEVQYDAGCGCSYQPPHQRNWQDVAETYNMNQPEKNENYKEEWGIELNKTWKFTSQL